MKILEGFEQGSGEWFSARAGIPTASEFDNLVTPGWKIKAWSSAGPNSYLCRKLAEWWIDGPLQQFQYIGAMGDLGHILEAEAKPGYALEYGQRIKSVPFITNDAGTVGCSPDGLLGEDGGIEIKCPEPHTHIRYLLEGEVPEEYLHQVHGSMYVTGRPWWRFFSYRKGMPWLVVQVNRDESLISIIEEAVEEFLLKFEAGKKQLIELNGGVPPARRPKRDPSVKFTWEMPQDENRGIIP